MLGIRFLGWHGIPSYCGINIGKPIQSFWGNFPILSLQKIFVSGSPCHALGTIPTNRTEKTRPRFFHRLAELSFTTRSTRLTQSMGWTCFLLCLGARFVAAVESFIESDTLHPKRYQVPKRGGTKRHRIFRPFLGEWEVPWTIGLTSKQLTKVWGFLHFRYYWICWFWWCFFEFDSGWGEKSGS